MSRYKLLGVLYALCLLENFIIRVVLSVKEISLLDSPFDDLLKILVVGAFNDTLFFGYFLVPFVLYATLVPSTLWKTENHKKFLQVGIFLIIALFSFQAHAEWFFWLEFSTRFNFIAVDYLLYTQEVLGNIRESYPLHWVFLSVFCCAAAIYYAARNPIRNAVRISDDGGYKVRGLAASAFLTVPVIVFFILGDTAEKAPTNAIVEQLSKNGLYQFAAAFRNNKLSYYSFYKTFDDRVVIEIAKKELVSVNSQWVNHEPVDLERTIENPVPEKRHNVILIAVESLSASYLGTFGNRENITPYLDRLAKESLLFTQMYATGTRTVRGLEALTLSLPPTPGYSIVKRQNNENLFSIGEMFKERGYELKFIYGGYGYFDNMNYFFENNGFKAIDRTRYRDDEVEFANIWGIADESLLAKTLKEADASYINNTPFFNFVLTTSNHRPYTYPDGRIDIPSKTGREGAVKYTDYSIGTFIEQAAKKPWFKDTIFVIVADHCATGKGRTHVPIQNYHIPLFIYAPQIVEPGIIDKFVSQIDIAPTILGLLNFSYKSRFMGKDIMKMQKGEERLLLGTYQNLSYYRDGTQVVLSPKEKVEYFNFDAPTQTTQTAQPNQERLQEAVGYYQYASYLLNHNYYGQSQPSPH